MSISHNVPGTSSPPRAWCSSRGLPEIAKKVGGYINKAFPHQINHLIVGDLGELEVLFFCYDDGDVVAYYTHQIAHRVLEGSRRSPVPEEFFHGNVGMSAWGLAIAQAVEAACRDLQQARGHGVRLRSNRLQGWLPSG